MCAQRDMCNVLEIVYIFITINSHITQDAFNAIGMCVILIVRMDGRRYVCFLQS